MKKTLVLILFLVCGLCVTAGAQTKLGVGLAYGTEIENLGITVNGEHMVTEEIGIAPSLIYFFPKEIIPGLDFKWFDINANGTYHFNSDSEFDAYALAGLNFAVISVPFINPFDGSRTSNSTTEVGLNLGAGFNYDTGGSAIPFAEMKYSISDFDQLVIMGGIRFNLN